MHCTVWTEWRRAGALALGLWVGSCAAPVQKTETPPNVELAQARAATHAQDWKLAASRWHEIFLKGDDRAPEACVETARALLMLRDAESAKGVLDVGIQSFPRQPDLAEMHGNVLVDLGFRRAAETAYEEALTIDPNRPTALLALARLRLDLGMHASAVEALERRIELGACDQETWLLAGRAYRGAGRLPEAYRAYDRAFQSGPADAVQLSGAASMYTDDRVRRHDPAAQALTAAWLERAIALNPQCTQAHCLLGMVREDRGDEVGAGAEYRRAAECDPGCAQALAALAQYYNRQGDHDSCVMIAKRALEVEKDSSRRTALEKLINETDVAGAEATPGRR
jgi:tetratricopeptide (TPR) repeat protein